MRSIRIFLIFLEESRESEFPPTKRRKSGIGVPSYKEAVGFRQQEKRSEIGVLSYRNFSPTNHTIHHTSSGGKLYKVQWIEDFQLRAGLFPVPYISTRAGKDFLSTNRGA